MKRGYMGYIVWGMAVQAFVTAMLQEANLITVTPAQQLSAGMFYLVICLILFLFTSVCKKET